MKHTITKPVSPTITLEMSGEEFLALYRRVSNDASCPSHEVLSSETDEHNHGLTVEKVMWGDRLEEIGRQAGLLR